MMKLISIFIIVISFSFPSHSREIIYPGKNNNGYIANLIRLALSYSKNTEYTVSPLGYYLPRDREYKFLERKTTIDIIADGATIERENSYLPIRFPILKGLNGWRVPLVHIDNKNLFANLTSEKELKNLLAVQFHSWSDSEILRSNGFNVYLSGDQKGLYRMLARKRVDYFPRSLLEVKKELKFINNKNIVADPNIFIHYPTAFYFYVNKTDYQLAKDINYGLEMALLDGSFDKLFEKYFGEAVKEIENSSRRIFELSNPLLSDKVPLQRKELWLDVYHNKENCQGLCR
ncbi:substrate-binding periplasmic protein [Thalassotalea agariperforans]